MEDQDLNEARAVTFRIFARLLSLFDFTGCYLLIRQLFKRVADGSVKVTYEPQVLALLVDSYRRSMANTEAVVFREELTFFYNDISKVNYREVELAFQYFISVALLVRFHASLGFNKVLLKIAKETVLDPIYTQVSEFRTLCELKEDTETFPGMDFLLTSLNDNMREINGTR
jgi:hypothetical protein